MLKKKNLLKIVSVFATLVFALFLYAPKVEAYGYKDELNVMLTGEGDFIIDPRAEQSLVIKIQYQYQVKDVQVYICKSTASSASCSGADNISTFKDLDNPEDPGGPMKVSPINGGNQGTKIYIYAPSAPYKGMPIRDYVDGDYKVVVNVVISAAAYKESVTVAVHYDVAVNRLTRCTVIKINTVRSKTVTADIINSIVADNIADFIPTSACIDCRAVT